jgi:hypothetical protein
MAVALAGAATCGAACAAFAIVGPSMAALPSSFTASRLDVMPVSLFYCGDMRLEKRLTIVNGKLNGILAAFMRK